MAASHLRRAWPIPYHQHYFPLLIDGPYWQHHFGETMGHQQVIGSIWLWATPMPSAVLHWNDSGPTGGHRQHLTWGELGQFHVIGIIYLFGEMGQLKVIGSIVSEQLWAISKSLAVSSYGPPPCHRQCCIGMILGQQKAIGSVSLGVSLANSMSSALPTSLKRWANSTLLAALFWSNCRPSASHQQYLVIGQSFATGSTALE